MTSILTRENLDLIALQLDRAGRVEQVTGLELLRHFESVDGFWNACVKMVTPTSAELSNLLKNTDEASAWLNGSMEQIIEIGIRRSRRQFDCVVLRLVRQTLRASYAAAGTTKLLCFRILATSRVRCATKETSRRPR